MFGIAETQFKNEEGIQQTLRTLQGLVKPKMPVSVKIAGDKEMNDFNQSLAQYSIRMLWIPKAFVVNTGRLDTTALFTLFKHCEIF